MDYRARFQSTAARSLLLSSKCGQGSLSKFTLTVIFAMALQYAIARPLS